VKYEKNVNIRTFTKIFKQSLSNQWYDYQNILTLFELKFFVLINDGKKLF